MNALTQRNRTLGELMTELRARTSFATQGSASKGNDLLMKSFLQEAHDYVYAELNPPALRKKAIIKTEAGSYLYDWHNDAEDEPIDPGRVRSVWCRESPTMRHEMTQGISEADRTDDYLREAPRRYDTLNGQMEVYPIPDREYDLVVEYIAGKGRFERMSDRTSVPDRLVFLFALANAKAHYRRPDASAAATAFTNMLSKAKSEQKGNARYFAESMAQESGSQVVATADGYRLSS